MATWRSNPERTRILYSISSHLTPPLYNLIRIIGRLSAVSAHRSISVAMDSDKVTCVGWDAFVAHCAPFVKTNPAPPECSGSGSPDNPGATTESGSDLTVCGTGLPTENPFKSVAKASSEKEMFGIMTAALNGANLCPDYLFVAAPHLPEDSEESVTDCGLYPRRHAPEMKIRDSTRNPEWKFGIMDWSWVELAIDCKLHPFDDDPFEHLDALKDDNSNTAHKRRVLRGLLKCSDVAFRFQHRTHLFMIFFVGDYFRILRIDRAGVFATERVNCREDGLKLAQFLWYFARQTPALRGHDTTATRIALDSDEAERMRARAQRVTHPEEDYTVELFGKLLDPAWPWWKLEVQDEANPGTTRYFLVGKPHSQGSGGVISRATRGYVAIEGVDSEDANFVYLKDSWRVVCDDFRKEGETLWLLQHHNVSYVPTLVCHGDIPGQDPLSWRIWPEFHADESCPLRAHQHYRLVVKEVCKPLKEFKNGFQLAFALACAVKAHSQAYSAGVIHCDISDGNILLFRHKGEWCGLLNDWEISRRVGQMAKHTKQRMGTWEFLSVAALDDQSKAIGIADEFESVLHVLLYMGLRFLPHNLDDAAVPRFIRRYFETYARRSWGVISGQTKYYAIHGGNIPMRSYNTPGTAYARFRFTWPLSGGEATSEDDATPDAQRAATQGVVSPAHSDGINPATAPDHPLDEISHTLLSWFKASYGLHVEEGQLQDLVARREQQKRPPDSQDENSPAYKEHLKQLELLRRVSGTRRKPLTKEELEQREAQRDEDERVAIEIQKHKIACYRELASKLKSHDAILKLFNHAIFEARWPDEDRCADRLSKKPSLPNIKPPEHRALSGSQKRDAKAVGDPLSTPPGFKWRRT